MSLSRIKRCLTTLAASALPLLAAFHAHAAPVSVPLTGLSFAPGTGYGFESDEKDGTLLDVVFESTLTSRVLSLAVGESSTIMVGTIELRERDANGGIGASETDDLTLEATLTFGAGFASDVVLAATGTAETGSVSDGKVDLTIDWSARQLDFGNNGLLEISLADLSFSERGPLTQWATFTLLSAPDSAVSDQRNDVPEPASLALLAAGLVGLSAARRRSR